MTADEPQTDLSDASKPVPLCHALDPFEGELIVSLLAGEEIPAFCQSETAWQMLWYMGPAITPKGVPVMVRQADLERAREILARHREQRSNSDSRTSDVVEDIAPDAPYEKPEQRDVRRGFWAAIIFFLSIFGLPLAIYSLYLLWRGRAAWHDPDPALRRRARRRITVGLLFNAVMLAFALFILSLMLPSSDTIQVPPDLGEPIKTERTYNF